MAKASTEKAQPADQPAAEPDAADQPATQRAAEKREHDALYSLNRTDGATVEIRTRGQNAVTATLRGDYAERVERKFNRLRDEGGADAVSRADQYIGTVVVQLGQEPGGPTPK